jgi:hypothetical protein
MIDQMPARSTSHAGDLTSYSLATVCCHSCWQDSADCRSVRQASALEYRPSMRGDGSVRRTRFRFHHGAGVGDREWGVGQIEGESDCMPAIRACSFGP